MSEFHIYCDESGNRPTTDDGDLSVTAAIACVDDGARRFLVPVPANKHYRHNQENVTQWLSRTGTFASYSIIRPYPGYKQALDREMRIYKYTLRKEVELGQPRRFPLAPEKVETTNYIWLFSMMNMLVTALGTVAYNTPYRVSRLKVFFDRKAMSADLRTFFSNHVRHELVPSAIRGLVNPYPHVDREMAENARGAAERLYKMKVDLEWDDDPAFSGDLGLLSLADGFAHYVHRELRSTNSRPGFLADLEKAGGVIAAREDFTPRLVGRRYMMWERRTGVQVPQSVIDGTDTASCS